MFVYLSQLTTTKKHAMKNLITDFARKIVEQYDFESDVIQQINGCEVLRFQSLEVDYLSIRLDGTPVHLTVKLSDL
jgi:hypothetical protein